MPLARSTFATAAASTSSLKSMVPTTWERSLGSATNGVVYGRSCAQVYSRPEDGGALDGPVQSAVGQQPVELLGQQHQRRDRRGVVRLVLEAVVHRDRQREEVGHPTVRPGDGLDPAQRRRDQDRQTQAAVTGEVLL